MHDAADNNKRARNKYSLHNENTESHAKAATKCANPGLFCTATQEDAMQLTLQALARLKDANIII